MKMFMQQKFLTLLLVALLVGTLVSCDEDDDDVTAMMPTGTVSVENQDFTGEMLTIADVTMSDDGWVVIHRDNGGSPMVPDIISVPKMVSAGNTSDVMVELKDGVELQDGETLWVMLHNDSGDMGTYEFDGSNGLDLPIEDDMGNIVTKSFTVNVMSEPTGSLSVEDQAVADNKVSISSITLDQPGFVVVHADNGEDGPVVPAIISEPLFLEAGTHEDVEVTFTEDAGVMTGDTLWAMLHTDTGEAMVYEFDGENGLDMPILTEEDTPVMMSFDITE
ncbi:hypothetical protein C723_2372 [Christiangramia flava JLT2011]|uniref:DUF7282 domain-containing protein n=2 Tax=Christiangramia TaxID=292691 RepID=A0A1L7I1N5_9FLAO|nr:hypothetical protein GRFL_0258 [Christiangramia flava JLT2011]OSS38654.1 hypothetical protein C723_2372 [Christiangramia flava JLT2011]